MNALAVLHDASNLEATVARARALLDDGDVMNARLLAAGAYDQAKAAGGYAARIRAGEALTAKARRLQGDALLIESRAKMRIAEEWDAAQEAGIAATKGRPKKVPDGNVLSLDDVGLTAKEIHEARKLADAERGAPGIVERAIEARLRQGLEPSRANLRAAVGTATATAEERGNNLYETPVEAMRVLLALECFSPRVWEPACGRGAILRPLEDAGYEVEISDLVDYGTATKDGECQGVVSFLETVAGGLSSPSGGGRGGEPAGRDGEGEGLDGRGSPSPSPSATPLPPPGGEDGPDIVTNPPYGADLNAFVAHALRVHRPRKMALLLNLNFLCGFDDADRCFAMDENPPARVHVFTRRLPMMHRDGWQGPEASSRMNCAWFIWELRGGRYAGLTVLTRVDWKAFEGRPALEPRQSVVGRRSSVEKAPVKRRAPGARMVGG